VLKSISHTEPDRIPIDLGSTPSSGISAIAYSNLIKYLGIQGTTRVYDVCQQVAQPEESVLRLFQVDVVDVGRTFNTREADWHHFVLSNGEPAEYPKWFYPTRRTDGSYEAFSPEGKLLARMPAGANFFDQANFPWADGYPVRFDRLLQDLAMVHWQAFTHSPWDHAGDPDFWSKLRENCLMLRETTDYALMIVAGCNLFEWGSFLRRLDNFLMDLASDHKSVERFLDAIMEQHLDTLNKVCSAVGDVVDILRFGDDLGTDLGPFMAPETYRKLFKPRERLLCDYVHKNSSMHTFLHSCGGISEFLPDLIEAGYEVINPVQTTARGMEPDRLKREFGKDITFWGGAVDTRNVLNKGTPREVKDQVKKRLDVFAPGGGYVFNAVHNILADVPPQNVIALYQAAEEFSAR
jgi:uroporphyrinogen decarboxylase